MKTVDLTRHKVVYSGRPWPSAQLPPTKDMAMHLERNESLISWLQPLKGSMQDQFPTIRFRDKYLTLSMRMMKSVWRHVRLRRGFVNRQTIPDIGTILRIPHSLLIEKIRTQQRFNVSFNFKPSSLY